jgi:Protein of unknwon function (DUF3310)
MNLTNTTGRVGDGVISHAAHYNAHPSGIEAIEIMRELTCNRAMLFKYVTRRGLKDPLKKDIQKALWYANDESNYEHRIVQPALTLIAQISLDKYVLHEKHPTVKNIYRDICGTPLVLVEHLEHLLLQFEKEV